MSRRTAIAVRVLWGLALLCLAGSVDFLLENRKLTRAFDDAQQAVVVRLEMDLSRTGSYSAPLRHT